MSGREMRDGDLTSLGASLEALFRRMGMSDPMVLSRLTAGWDELAGTPWSGRSKPLFIQGKTLVVEAGSPSMVAFLRYGSADLVAALARALGDGVIEKIEVRAPSTR
jgi:predicted nucleic acid-binding Zn ribbon protein